MSKLYHKDIFLPPQAVKRALGHYRLTFSAHASRACADDRYGRIIPANFLRVEPNNIIEMEVAGNDLPVKVVCRLPYDNRNDICIVALIIESGSALCKTLWLNRKDDTHRTLDRSKYHSK
jgi:hypothetical protein